MKKFYVAMASVFAATSLWAADILEIRPCDEYGNSVSYPVATKLSPIGSGYDIYFNVRLVSREENTSAMATTKRSYFSLTHNPDAGTSEEYDATMNPLQIGIVVGSKTKWARLIDLRKTPISATSTTTTLNMTDLIFAYHTEPGDFGLPVKLAADDQGTPAGENDKTSGYIFRNQNKWNIYYHAQNGGAVTDAVFLFNTNPTQGGTITLSDHPEGTTYADYLSSNYSLKDCGFHVQTVDFADTWASESIWKVVQEGLTTKGQLEAVATLTNAATLYVWSEDESVVKLVGSNVSTEEIVVSYAGGKATTKKVNVASITIQGGQFTGDFQIKGVTRDKETNLVLSNFKGYNWNVAGTGGTMIEDFKTVRVSCSEPPDPSLTLTRVNTKQTDVYVTSDYATAVSQIRLTLIGQTYSNDMTVTIAPYLKGNEALQTNRFVRINTEGVEDGWKNSKMLDITLRKGESEAIIDVFGLGAKSGVTDGTENNVKFTIVDVKDDDGTAETDKVKKFLTGGWKGEDHETFLRLVPQPTTIVEPSEGQTLKAQGNVPINLDIKIVDNYYNINDTNTGYTIWWKNKSTDANETQVGDRWGAVRFSSLDASGSVLYKLYKMNKDGSIDNTVRPQVTYSTDGSYTSTLRIVAPNGKAGPGPEALDTRTVYVNVSAPATATATVCNADEEKVTGFDEVTDGLATEGYIKVTLSEPYSQPLYAFLAPTSTNFEQYVFCEYQTNSVVSTGDEQHMFEAGSGTEVLIPITILDGTSGNGTKVNYGIKLCTSESYDEEKVVGTYVAKSVSFKVKNVEPAIDYDSISVNGYRPVKHTDGTYWIDGDIPKSTTQKFSFFVSDSDADRDATATGKEFYTQMTFTQPGATYSPIEHKGNPNGQTFERKFTKEGEVTVNINVRDKDMTAGKYVRYEFHMNIVALPYITISTEGDTKAFYESAEGTQFMISLSEAPTEDITMQVTVTKNANGLLKLAGCTYVEDGVYTLTFKEGETEKFVTIDEADGIGDGGTSTFMLEAKVISTTEKESGLAWKDYYVPGRFTPVMIKNVPPTLTVDGNVCELPSGYMTGSIELNSSNSPISVAIGGKAEPINWSASDVPNDLTKQLTVTLRDQRGSSQTNVTDDAVQYSFTPQFNKPGLTQVTITAADKDGGKITAIYWYQVDAAKMLATIPVGPSGAMSTKAGKYTSPGRGHVWTAYTASDAVNYMISWNCGLENNVTLLAQGYNANDVDDGKLSGGNDVGLTTSGGLLSKGGTAFRVADKYDDGKDSFFYCWISATTDGEESTAPEGEVFGAVSPQTSTNQVRTTNVTMPTEALEDGSYLTTYMEAVFAKEYLRTDNIGDINQDGIPDIYVKAYKFDVFDADGNLTGDDVLTINSVSKNGQTNGDADYFPFIFSDVQALFTPSASTNWTGEARAFTAKLEIRGWGDGLNDAYDVLAAKGYAENIDYHKCEKRYTDPAKDADSSLNALEYDAWVQAGKPANWSPERPTDPTADDTDDDGLPDGYEYYIWYKAHVGYFDNDGTHKYLEGRRYNPTDLHNPTVLDHEKLAEIFDPLTPSGSDWDTMDTDWDGIPDSVEFMLGTNPFDFDSDNDGLPDGYEVAFTETDPLKYATDDVNCDATRNDDGDAMAIYSEAMPFVAVVGSSETEYYCFPGGSNLTYAVDFEKPATGTVIKVKGIAYVTASKLFAVYTDDAGKVCLGCNLTVNDTWACATNATAQIIRGTPTAIARGTVLDAAPDYQAEYFDEYLSGAMGDCYVAFRYGDGYARAKKTTLSAAQKKPVVIKADAQAIKVIHYHVYQTHPYDSRTGWYFTVGCVESAPYTHLDELLSMTFFYRTGTITAKDITPALPDTPMTKIWTKNATHPADFDTDQDHMPDGWEFYLMAQEGEKGPTWKYSPLFKFQNLTTNEERDNDHDALEWPEEFSGVASSAKYGWTPTFPMWRNKTAPTDPWNKDTDGDGVIDGSEGGVGAANSEGGTKFDSEATIVKAHFMYNEEGKAGGGLNPLSWDTDGDGLPDPWEIEFHGTYTAGSTKTITYEIFDDGTKSETEATIATTTTVTQVIGIGATWNMDGMDGTVTDHRLDYDHDGLDNWQEYMVGAMRCWRYDDLSSGWGMHTNSFDDMPEFDLTENSEWNKYWAERLLDTNNETGKYNPDLANGYFDPGIYFSQCTNAFDSAKGGYYMFRDGRYHCLADKATNPNYFWGMSDAETMTLYTYSQAPKQYICCNPTRYDTDFDGMDDFYELFHGLNPLLGYPARVDSHAAGIDTAFDVVYDAYARAYGSTTYSLDAPTAINNWWRNSIKSHRPANIKNTSLGGYDFIAHPWLNGSVTADPDGDNIVNQEEAIMPKVQASSTYHHSDPTPLWMTDTSYDSSLTRRYYKLTETEADEDTHSIAAMDPSEAVFVWNGVKYNLWNFPGFTLHTEVMIPYVSFDYTANSWEVTDGWAFSFEENEGYDSDHDFLSDFEEAQGKTKNASSPLEHDDPLRRQAMYFGGEKNPSFLQTPLRTDEREPVSPGASSEARQNFLYYTVECWAKPDAAAIQNDNQVRTLVERAVYANTQGPADESRIRRNFMLGIRNGKWYTCFDSTGSDAKQTVEIADAPAATTNWTHLAATFDGTALKLYIDGICTGTSKDTSIQPEHGIAALAVNGEGEMNPHGGTRDYSYITITVGASPATLHGFVYDWAWRGRYYQYIDDDNPLGLTTQTTFDDYKNFYQGYVDEVRIWDGARSAADILSDVENRTRYTTALAEENRQAVYNQWRQGALRSPASELQLPAQLMYHWAFDHIAGAVLTNDLIQVPAGFDTAAQVTDAKARWVRPETWVESNWANSEVKSTVYAQNHWVPWINNTVSHLPRFDLTTLDSVYWSEDYAGAESASDAGYTAFTFPRSNEVYSRWTQMQYENELFYDRHFDPLCEVYNVSGPSANTEGYTQKTRWYVISDYASISATNTSELVYKMKFAIRDRNTLGDDLLPMGGAYPRRISMAEGGMWDNKAGEIETASDAWAQTGKDSDNNGLPDWWEEYARANYCEGLSPHDELQWDTQVNYNGITMSAYQAYLRDLAKGLVKIGDNVAYDANYADTRDADKDNMPDWWEELYGLDTSVDNADDDPDNDGLSNYQEYMLAEVYPTAYNLAQPPYNVDVGKINLNPTLAYSSLGQKVPDYFLAYTNVFQDVKTGKTSHFYLNEYFGEIVTDHDFIEDWWENCFALSYTSAKKYDPSADKDGDGWSTWAECRASLWGGYFAANFIDKWAIDDSDQYLACYPQPIIGIRATYYGKQDISGKQLVVRTTSGQTARTDAMFVVPATVQTQTRYIGAFAADNTLHGHLSPGMIDPTTVVFERALTGAEKQYGWSFAYYETNETYTTDYEWERTTGTFDEYRAVLKKWPMVELLDSDLAWEMFATTKDSADGTKAELYIESTLFGTVDCTTGEYELDMSKFSGEKSFDQYTFRVQYGSRLGHSWPQTVYLSDTCELSGGSGDGYVREGKNTIEAFIDLDASGTYTPGEPYGVVQNVDVGWHKTPVTVIELTDTSHVVPRFDVSANSDDRAVVEGTSTSSGNDEHGGASDETATGLTKKLLIRRIAINGNETAMTSAGVTKAVPNRTLLTKTLNVDSRSYLTEADILGNAKFDLDSKWLVRDAEDKLGLTRSEITEATYEILEVMTLADGTTSNTVLRTFVNTFYPQRTKAAAVSPVSAAPVYTASPTLAFTSGDETMTAYRVQIRRKGETALIYDSGDGTEGYSLKLLPGRVPNAAGTAVYEITPSVYAGARVCDGQVQGAIFADGESYQWRVVLYNAKFNTVESDEDWSDWADFQMDVNNQNRYPDMATGYGAATAAVRYYGPTNVVATNVWVEAFENADFRGQPAARMTLSSVAQLADRTDVAATNVVLCGIAPGTWYFRAFIDFNGNGQRDDWESWGYFNWVGTGVKAIYNPKPFTVTSAQSDWAAAPTANFTIFIEDCDTNQNEIPDCTEASFYNGDGGANATDIDGDGIPDSEEETYSTDAQLWDTDSDGMPDGWEAKFADTDPTLSDADEVLDGDVMAFAKVDATFIVTTNGSTRITYALIDPVGTIARGNSVKGLEAYTTYSYPVYEDGKVVEYLALGTNVTLTAETKIVSDPTAGQAVIVHAQVYDWFHFNAKTANANIAEDERVNTKAFTALDKYLVVRYLEALGLANEADVNKNGLWKQFTLKPYETDYDADGVPDGWELYVMFGPTGAGSVASLSAAKISPWNYSDARTVSPGDVAASLASAKFDEAAQLTLLGEYLGMPTDPWNTDTDGDNVIDRYYHDYMLWASSDDTDNDGLSNYAEYLISKVFKLADLDPNNAKTDGTCVDYFRRATGGDLYFGEMFTDHDQVSDDWELGYDAYANSGAFDPARDDDEDGWSNWSEAKIGTHPGASQSVGVDGLALKEYPVPAIAAKVIFRGDNGGTKLTGNLVFQAWSQQTDPDMTSTPDAIWTVTSDSSTNMTKYVGLNPGKKVSYHLGTGVVKPGSLKVWFRDRLAEDAYFRDGVEVSTSAGTNPRWYYFVQDAITGDDSGDLLLCATNRTAVKVGSIDYSTGLATIDFGSATLQGIVYDNWVNGSASEDEAKTTGITATCAKINLARSFVKLEWTPVKIDTAGNTTYYLSDAMGGKGHVREGLNKFVVFSDTNASGTWDPGEPFGFVRNVDVGWQGGAFDVELTETSPIFARVVLRSGSSSGSSESSGETSTSSATTDRELVTAFSSTITDLSKDSSDINALCSQLNAVVLGKGTTEGEEESLTLEDTQKIRIRVVRALVDGSAILGYDKDGNEVPVPHTVVMNKFFDLSARAYIHEGDFLDDDCFDIDAKRLAEEVCNATVYNEGDYVHPKFVDPTQISYMIVLGESDLTTSNVVFKTLVTRVYDMAGARFTVNPTNPSDALAPEIDAALPGETYGACPTFRWRMRATDDQSVNGYTAFKLQIRNGNTVVYDSGFKPAPARDANGWYAWTLTDPLGSVVGTSGTYTWRVSMYNAKFPDETFWDLRQLAVAQSGKYTGCVLANWSVDGSLTVNVNQQQAMNDKGYSSVAACVKYVGPACVLAKADTADGKIGRIRLQAFETADFAGDPVGETFVTGVDAIRDTGDISGNAVICGLPQTGTYYLRAFIDSNGNGVRDDFESWGEADEPVTLSTDVVTRPTVGIYIEDCDTDGDWIPDAYEYAKAGWTGDWADVKVKLSAKNVGGDAIQFTAPMRTAGISTGLTGASLAIFQLSDAAIITALGDDFDGTTKSIAAIRKAVEKVISAGSVKITALTLAPDGKSVTLYVDAEVTDSIAGQFLGQIYDMSGYIRETASVTVRVYSKKTLAQATWDEVGSFPCELGKGAADITVDVSGAGIDMSSGFYKVTVEDAQ